MNKESKNNYGLIEPHVNQEEPSPEELALLSAINEGLGNVVQGRVIDFAEAKKRLL